MCFPAETPWLAALAGLKHPFPSRTRPLRAHAAMILRPGARESSALPTSLSTAPRGHKARGAFFRMAWGTENALWTRRWKANRDNRRNNKWAK